MPAFGNRIVSVDTAIARRAATLPVPSVAVDSLAAAPSRAPARKPAPSIDDDVAEASPKVRAGSSSLNFEPNNLVLSLLRF
ncbi:hypothetical protein GCM10011497_37500 [Elstera cyanobacteriorum]|uniref:Uncharacterized protein n=1 Tax=Elstera cyanobacteriorum TaxID=2022747 RepID=A0A255Y0K5_9PROT|nr:hypothetical protein CHR90_00630 [Elstera cyanobacteriorum]GGA03493.1 hypothetical protein GCM10011497_37500 [Elstera cyanobacteriorum]